LNDVLSGFNACKILNQRPKKYKNRRHLPQANEGGINNHGSTSIYIL